MSSTIWRRLRDARGLVHEHYELGARSQRLYANPLLAIHRLRLLTLWRIIDRDPSLVAGADLLDVGGGDLYTACLLAETGWTPRSYTCVDPLGTDPRGFDLDGPAERNAETLERRHGIPVEIVKVPIERYSPKQPRDAALVLETLEHVPDEPGAIAKIRDALGPDGRLVVSMPVEIGPAFALKEPLRALVQQRTTHAPSEYLHATLGQTEEVERVTGTHKGYDHRRTQRLLDEAGFERIEETTYPPVPAPFAYGICASYRSTKRPLDNDAR